MRASVRILITSFLIFLTPTLSLAQEVNQPPTVEILGRQGDNHDGTLENPFNGTGIALQLKITDPDGGFYDATWQASWGGSFCPGVFQWFGTEGFRPFFVSPRVRRGLARITIISPVVDQLNRTIEAERTFIVEPHPDGCEGSGGGDDPGGDSPSQLQLQASPVLAQLGQTINLTASAKDSNDSSLTFMFYVSTSASLSNKGDLIASRTGSGCSNGCTASTSFQASSTPTTHYFMFEARDGDNVVASPKKAVPVTEDGGGGVNPPPPPVPDPEHTWTECSSCESRVDAGPLEDTVVGGHRLVLRGDVEGPQANSGVPIQGTFRWVMLDDGGLGSTLQILNFASLNATLETPEVEEDTEVVLGLEASYSGCTCADEMRVTILAEAPPAADVSVQASAPGSVEFGEDIPFSFEVANDGPDTAEDVEVTVVLPQGLQYKNHSSSRGACSESNRVVTCDLNNMTRHARATIDVLTEPESEGEFVAVASVRSGLDDPDTFNNDSQALSHVAGSAVDLALSMTGPDPEAELRVDGEAIYEIKVENVSNGAANNVTVVNPLADKLLFVAAIPDRGSCVLRFNTREVVCRMGRMEGGEEAVIELLTRPQEPGTVINSATVGSDEEDAQPGNNEASLESTVVAEEADLSVQVLASAPTVSEHALLTYTITIKNAGPGLAGAVTLISPIPQGLTSPSAVPERGSCTISAEEVQCSLGALEVGEEVSVTVDVQASGEGLLVSTVEVASGEDDPNMENNSDSAEVMVESLGFTLVPLSLGLPNTFVSMALVNLAGGPNAIDIDAVGRDGLTQSSVSLETPSDRGQTAFLTNEVFTAGSGVEEEATLVARGRQGRVRSFFMMGDNGLRRLDGIGGSMADGDELYFPMVRSGAASDTVLFVFNPGSDPASDVLFELFDAQGNLMETALASMASMGSLRTTLKEMFGDFGLEEGYVKVSSDVSLRGFEVLNDAGNFASLTAKVPRQVRRLVVPHFLATADATTWLRLLNLNETPAGGTLKLFDDSGNELASAPIELGAFSLTRFDLQELFDFEQLEVITGYLEIRLSGGTAGVFERAAHVVATVSYESGTFHAALPMAEKGFKENYFLHVAQSDEIGVFHGLAILNGGETAAQGLVEVFDKDGQPSGQAEFTLEPGQRVVDLLNGPEFFQAGFSQVQGHIKITSDHPVISFALFGGADFLAAIGGQGVAEEEQ
ncbi:MAG TPA: DUF11 domain-containing protein [Acidobacteriota bacterium]|nr:DUF11 domain-containing protein [Acidobacteriota bacterium]